METNSQNNYTENQLSKIILDAAFRVHTKTGPGLLETVYEVLLAYELRKQGLQVQRQVPIRIHYDDLVFDEGFRADLLVEDKVIVELKSVEQLVRVHSKQVLTQLRLSQRRLGLLINFGEVHLKNGIERIVNGLPEESPRPALVPSFFPSLRPLRPLRESRRGGSWSASTRSADSVARIRWLTRGPTVPPPARAGWRHRGQAAARGATPASPGPKENIPIGRCRRLRSAALRR